MAENDELYKKDKYKSNNLHRGLDHLKNPYLNKGIAFKIEERQALGFHGLLPPRVMNQEEQLEICLLNINRLQDDLDKYIYLMDLKDRNLKLFYRFLHEHINTLLPIVYTPVVGLACQKYSLITTNHRGLFITIYDKGHVYEVLKNWPESDVRMIVVTDGERILGLGDLGAQGMGIPVGKLTLCTALAGVQPHQCLPITLDVGTNRKELLNDKTYIGIHKKRAFGYDYDAFIDEFVQAVVRCFGQTTLIQFEDFANKNSFRLLEKYRHKYCTYNDDIQGTASVVLAGLHVCCKVKKDKIAALLSNNCFLFLGAGSAALGISHIIVLALKNEGLSEEEAKSRIFLFDKEGLLVKSRKDLSPEKMKFSQDYEPIKIFADAVKSIKPSILIGAAGAGRLFTPDILKSMANINKRPVIFALSNPTSKAECTAQEAYTHTDGRVMFASGSPFPPVMHDGKKYYPSQANNAYIFPGVSLGITCTKSRHVSDNIFYKVSKILSQEVTPEEIEKGSIYPAITKIQKISLDIATGVAEISIKEGNATVFPEPKDIRAFIKAQMFNPAYLPSVQVHPWPQDI